MVGKARVEFLHSHGGLESGYDYKRWHEKEEFDWDELLGWVKERGEEGFKSFWPDSIAKLIEKHTGKGGSKFLVLLQAAHGIVSGTEKNLPDTTSWYLSQLLPHIWLSSPFGHPKRNLTAEPPEVLS
ncbi:MAG: CRISPR-associated protein Csx11, partial [Pseudothermotoga sp.]